MFSGSLIKILKSKPTPESFPPSNSTVNPHNFPVFETYPINVVKCPSCMFLGSEIMILTSKITHKPSRPPRSTSHLPNYPLVKPLLQMAWKGLLLRFRGRWSWFWRPKPSPNNSKLQYSNPGWWESFQVRFWRQNRYLRPRQHTARPFQGIYGRDCINGVVWEMCGRIEGWGRFRGRFWFQNRDHRPQNHIWWPFWLTSLNVFWLFDFFKTVKILISCFGQLWHLWTKMSWVNTRF